MSVDRPIGVGLVGCGEIAQLLHLPILNELDGFTIAGLCDLSADTVAHLSKRWSVAATTTDFEELIALPEVDAVLVCTFDHVPVVAAALAAGKHVLVEKPLAFTPDEARSLQAAAEAAGVVAQVGYMKLYDPGMELARERVAQLKGVRAVTCHNFAGSFSRHFPLYDRFRGTDVDTAVPAAGQAEVSARIKAMLGSDRAGHADLYSLLLMLGSHDLSVLRALFGPALGVVFAQARGENQLTAVLEYADEVLCVLELGVGTSYPWWDEWVSVTGDDQSLRIEFPNPYIRYGATLLQIKESIAGSASDSTVLVSNEDPFRREWVDFSACIQEGRAPRSTFAGAIADLELARDIVMAMTPVPDGATA
jgi:predicted dehydrogenase